jgi:hypothetical protein
MPVPLTQSPAQVLSRASNSVPNPYLYVTRRASTQPGMSRNSLVDRSEELVGGVAGEDV